MRNMSEQKVEFVKGEAILSELGWVKHKKGLIGIDKVMEDLNADRPDHLKVSLEDFNPNDWYPVDNQESILKSIRDNFGDGDPEILKEVGAYGVQNITNFKFFLRFMKVHTVAKKMRENLLLLYRSVDVNLRKEEENMIEMSIQGFPKDKVFCKLMEGGIEQILEFLKLENGSVDETECAVEGKLECIYVIRWD